MNRAKLEGKEGKRREEEEGDHRLPEPITAMRMLPELEAPP